MREEIKEILESSRKIIKSNRENGFDRIIMLGDDIDKIIDYITNLQQENGNLKTNEQINVEVHNKQVEIIKDYKSRCEKAINSIDILQEIIYQQPTDNKADDMWLLDKLDGFKNILNGSD